MLSVVVINCTRHRQSFGKRLCFDFRRLHVQHANGVSGKRNHVPADVETGLALIDRRKFHATNRATPGLVGFDPRMHGALVVEDFALHGLC